MMPFSPKSPHRNRENSTYPLNNGSVLGYEIVIEDTDQDNSSTINSPDKEYI